MKEKWKTEEEYNTHFPSFSQDTGQRVSCSEIIQEMADYLEAGKREDALMCITHYFIFGAWPHIMNDERYYDRFIMHANLRCLVEKAYEEGFERGVDAERYKK